MVNAGAGVVPVDGDGHEESPAWQIGEMKSLAERSGLLPAEALEVYERLVRAVEVTAHDAKKITSPEMLDLLIDAKLVERSHTSDDALYFAVGPDLGLLTMMALSGRTAAEALDGLTDAMRSLGSIPAAALRTYAGRTSITGDRNDAGPTGTNFRESLGLQLVTERHRILELTGYGGLSSEARYELCSVETAVMEAHFTEVTVREPTPLMQDAGVRSRTLVRTPTKMKIVDGHTALVALTSTGANEALLVRNKFLAGALHHYFDLMWDGATPLEINSKGRVVERAIPKADGLSAREQRIVLGLKNNKTLGEIAREVKISEHTVSRTVEKIMAQLGVEGRVALLADWQAARARTAAELAADRESLRGDQTLVMPTIRLDRQGLGVSGAMLAFTGAGDSPTLFDSALGSLALYFRGPSGAFSTASYDALTERARLSLPTDADPPGELALLARITEAPLDALTATVTAEPDATTLCTLEITLPRDGDTIVETWPRLPRDAAAFAAILNGTPPRSTPAR